MEEDSSSSWVCRAKFSHTVCHPLDASRFPSISLNLKSEQFLENKLKSSASTSDVRKVGSSLSDKEMTKKELTRSKSEFLDANSLPFLFSSRHENIRKAASESSNFSRSKAKSFEPQKSFESKTKSLGFELDDKFKIKSLASSSESRLQLDAAHLKSNVLRRGSERTSKVKQRSKSPLPTTMLSDTFKEARAHQKRFSTPPPSRKAADRGVFGRFFSREAHDHHTFSSTSPPGSPVLRLSSAKTYDKLKNKKDSPLAKYFDNGGGRVTAAETTEQWTVDLSKLYLGLRFASGAHSRLYHGIYKDMAVAVKIIRQPDDDENKVMGTRLEKQFTREVTFLSHLYHKNVIKLAGACKKPPVFCIITEYLCGGSLRSFLHKLENKSLSLKKLNAIALDIARGMEYIHSQGVIHRDLKPENVLFDEEFCAKIADFGIACEEAYLDALAEDPGTYRWMAPEMIKHKHYGRKVDVYSFGLILWEMITGRIPYEDMTPAQAAFAVVDKNLRPAIPSTCPTALRVLIEKCWSLHPEKRPDFWQIVKVLEHFESVLAHDGTLDWIPSLPLQDQKKRLNHWAQKLKHPIPEGLPPSMPKLL